MDVTVTLPLWLPASNLFLSIIICVAALCLTVRAIHRGARGPAALVRGAFVWACVAVILSGSLSQLGFLSVEVWAALGTGGRVAMAVTLVTLVTIRT